jgi:hypothetical protein
MAAITLKPCPICALAPNRFFVGRENIEVIACQKGCKPRVFGFVVHITSVQIEGLGWADLGDVWNTIRIEKDPEGQQHIVFDKHPARIKPQEVVGQFLAWSPQIAARKARELAIFAKATGA